MHALDSLLTSLPEPMLRWADVPAELVWTNQLGGQTYRLHTTSGPQFLKHQHLTGLSPADRAEVDLVDQSRRLRWAAPFTPVPQVLDSGEVADDAWLLTTALPGTNPLTQRWLEQEPERAVTAIGRGLRRFHEALPVADCPFTCHWLEPKLTTARAAGTAPSVDQLVVIHGDPCVPNTLLDNDGEPIAHVDLGALGLADRWVDLAVASMSISWDFNFGPGYEEYFFTGYGVEPDPERIAFYRSLW